jgi:hypothetical protein
VRGKSRIPLTPGPTGDAVGERLRMNAAMEALLLDVVRRLENNIKARDCPAIVALDGTRRLLLSDYDSSGICTRPSPLS